MYSLVYRRQRQWFQIVRWDHENMGYIKKYDYNGFELLDISEKQWILHGVDNTHPV